MKMRKVVNIKVKKIKKDGFGILKGIGKFTKKDELKGHFD